MPAARNQEVTVRRSEAKSMPSMMRGPREALRGSSQRARSQKILATEVGRCDNAMIGSLVRCVLITSSSPGSRSSSTLRQPIGAKSSFPIIGCRKLFTRLESISHSHKVQKEVDMGALRGVPHPFPYQGTKRQLARQIVSCIPLDTKRLIEPFAGSAAITLASAHASSIAVFFLDDAHDPLMKLWRKIVD